MGKNSYIGAGIVFVTPKNKILLLQKQNKKMTFPGGHREQHDKTPLQTAQRECKEEVGFLPKGRITGKLKIFLKKDKEIIYSFFMEVPKQFTPTLSSEHCDYKWVSYKNMKADKLTNIFKPYWGFYQTFIENFLNK